MPTRHKSKLVLLVLLLFSTALSAAEVRVIALFTDKALLQIDGEQKIVKKGETFNGVLLKSASGRGALVEIDGKTVKLGLNQRIAGGYKKPRTTTARIYPDARGMYYVEGKINGAATRFLVDTGATYVTLSGDKALSLDIDFFKGSPGTAETASAVIQVWQVRLNTVDIGGILVRNVEATVIEGNQPFDVLLGNSFLRRTRMQQAGSVLELHRRF